MNKTVLWVGVIIIVLSAIIYVVLSPAQNGDEAYNPALDPRDFTAEVTNPYFKLTPGTKYIYEADKPEGHERIETTVLSEKKNVMGIIAVMVKDQVFLNGSLIEDTVDWYAQDKEGNVWYLGEKTAEYENGVLTTTAGSWEAGVDGARPGIIMKANPKVGETYRQEYYAGEAEDMARIESINETVSVPYGTYSGCLKTYDYTPLNPKAKEYKYYCKNVGGITLEVNLEDNEKTELVSIERIVSGPPQATPQATTPAPKTPTPTPSLPIVTPSATSKPPANGEEISEAEAKAIALKMVPGTVTAVEAEIKFGKDAYVIEIDPGQGKPETDVIVDRHTGNILGIEQ